MDSTPTKRIITDHDVAQLAAAANKAPAKLDAAKMVSLRIRHRKTNEEIAELMDCHPITVGRVINKFMRFVEDPGELEAYRQNKPDLFEAMELKVLSLLNERLNDKDYKPSIKDLTNAMKVLVETRRLETGQSTDNVAVFVKSIENAHKNLFIDSPQVTEVPHVDQGCSPDAG
jgi:hypothetical protein